MARYRNSTVLKMGSQSGLSVATAICVLYASEARRSAALAVASILLRPMHAALHAAQYTLTQFIVFAPPTAFALLITFNILDGSAR
jgi:hypothetical protein